MALVEQRVDHVRPDEAGPAGDDDVHGSISVKLRDHHDFVRDRAADGTLDGTSARPSTVERLHYSRPLVRGAGIEEGTQRVQFLRRVTVLVAVATISVLGSVVPAHAADGDSSDGGSSGDVSAQAIGSSGEYIAITPTRILDTRDGTGGLMGRRGTVRSTTCSRRASARCPQSRAWPRSS